MSERSSGAMRQGANAAGRAGSTAYGAGRRVSRLIPLKWRLIIGGIILAVLFLCIIVGGASSTSMDSTYFLTAENEADEEHAPNAPETEEEMTSVYSEQNSIEMTMKLADIINAAKMADRQSIEQRIRKQYSDKNVTIECDTDTEEVYLSTLTSGSSAGGLAPTEAAENIAKTAEQLAWPDGTSTKTYHDRATPACKKAARAIGMKRPAADCGNFVQIVVCTVLGKNKNECKNFLNQALDTKGDVEKMQKKVSKFGFSASRWDGKMTSLQRGDILIYKNKGNTSSGSGQHIFVYLGNNMVAEASHPRHYYGHLDKKSPGRGVLSNGSRRKFFYVIRAGGSTATASPDELAANLPESYQEQNSYTELANITPSTGERYSLDHPGSGRTMAQSFAYLGDSYAVAFVTPRSGVTGTVRAFDKSGKVISGGDESASIYHGNGSCTTPNGTLLVAGSLKGGRLNKAVEFTSTGGKLSKKGDFKLPRGASAIAYDRASGKYAIAQGSSMTVYDSDMKKLLDIKRNVHTQMYQDIGAANGYIYSCHTSSGGGDSSGRNYVDIYDENTGKYCGSYKVSYGELESADVVDNELVLLVHAKGSSKNYIHKTGLTVGASSVSQGTATGVTKTDLQLLSAYSISLANSELVFEKDADLKEENDTLSGRYFSKLESRLNGKKGKPVKLYWFGKDRGKINYEKDLKSKVDDWELYDRNYDISETGEEVKATLTLKPLPVLMEKLFGVMPDEPYENAMTETQAINAEADENVKKNLTKNVDATYTLADNTAQLLFNGEMGAPGMGAAAFGLFAGGELNFPLPPGTWTFTSDFGHRWGRLHSGVDLGAAEGTPIYAAAAGTVTRSEFYAGYGNCIDIDHGNGIVTRYGHQSKRIAQKGDIVQAGQLIGEVGNTGHSFGNHLHFEVIKNGQPTDPKPYIGMDGMKPK